MVPKKSSPPPSDPQPEVETFPTSEDAELADQPGDKDLEKRPPGVRYVGEFGAREITAEDWRKAGVKDQPGARWERGNGWTLPLEGFTEHALRVLAQDGLFVIDR